MTALPCNVFRKQKQLNARKAGRCVKNISQKRISTRNGQMILEFGQTPIIKRRICSSCGMILSDCSEDVHLHNRYCEKVLTYLFIADRF